MLLQIQSCPNKTLVWDAARYRPTVNTLNVNMKWSKLKQLVEERITPSLQSRFAINSTAYGACTCGHAWITIDKEVVANFCTRAFWNRSPTFDKGKEKYVAGTLPEGVGQKYEKQLVEYGELSRQDAYEACWDFVHKLSIDEALISDDALIQTLAVIDSRVGKRKISKIDLKSLHPLARKLLLLRAEVEKITCNKQHNTDYGAKAPPQVS